ncbi:hypothetical protein VH567_11725 [Sphingomonas sp. 4RDLI-65]|uniref:hypothetical protein n=1 Tax=Sphingomonas sp. 4RDLI-65 TaxID=3111641 RepID=UPI003C1CBCC1
MLVASPVGAARIDLDTGWRFRPANDAPAAPSWLQGNPAGANRIVVAASDRPGFATSPGYAMRRAGSGSVWFAGSASADSARTDILTDQLAATAKVSARRLGRLTPFTVTVDILTAEGARAGVVRAYEPFEAGSTAYPPDPAHLPKDP